MARRPAPIITGGRKRGKASAGVANAVGKLSRKSVKVAASQGIAEAVKPLPDMIMALAKTLDAKNMQTNKMLEVNQRIATDARDAMASGYESRLPRNTHSYRSEERLTGRLGPALRSDAMIAGTSKRVISFINFNHLNQQAKHWYRTNYGAVGRGGVPAGRFSEPETYRVELHFNGQSTQLAALRDPQRAAPQSYLPRTFMWVGSGTGAELHPRKPAKPVLVNQGKGTRAARFTDLGYEVVAQRFMVEYDQLFREYGAKNRKRLAKKGIDVPLNVRAERYGFTVNGKAVT